MHLIRLHNMNWHHAIVIIIFILLAILGGLFVMTTRIVPDSPKPATNTTSKIDLARKAKEQTSQLRENRIAKLRHFHKTTKPRPIHHKAISRPKKTHKLVKRHHKLKLHVRPRPKPKSVVKQRIKKHITPRHVIHKSQPAPRILLVQPKSRPQLQIPATCIQWAPC